VLAILLFEYYLFYRGHNGLGGGTEENRERNKKYFAYQRMDLDRLTRLKIYPVVWLMFPRVILGYSGMFVAALLLWVISLT